MSLTAAFVIALIARGVYRRLGDHPDPPLKDLRDLDDADPTDKEALS